jgi:ankyrin repeat protein
MWAVDGGLLQEVRLLLETPEIDLKPDNYGNTIFHLATRNGHLKDLEHDCPPNQPED